MQNVPHNSYLNRALCVVVLKLGRFGKYIRNTLKFSNYGAGEGWRRSVGLIV
jgi:hypothetical protein